MPTAVFCKQFAGAAVSMNGQYQRQQLAGTECRRFVYEPFALSVVYLGGEAVKPHILPCSSGSEIAVADAQPPFEAEHKFCHAAVFFICFGIPSTGFGVPDFHHRQTVRLVKILLEILTIDICRIVVKLFVAGIGCTFQAVQQRSSFANQPGRHRHIQFGLVCFSVRADAAELCH